MKKIETVFWDFDGTLGYREGMWSGTLHSILLKNNVRNIPLEDVGPFLNIGFTWHSPDTPHKDLFKGKTWWEYHTSYFEEIFVKLGIDGDLSRILAKQVRDEYLDLSKWHLHDDSREILRIVQGQYKNFLITNMEIIGRIETGS